MEYVKLYVTLRDDPKIIGLSDNSFRAYITTLCWMGQHETDGRVPDGLLTEDVVAELRARGLLESDQQGHIIHNWIERQKSHDELEALRQARRAAGSRGGLAKAKANPKQTPSKNVAEVEVEVEKELEQLQELETTTLSLRDDFEAFYSAFPPARKGARRPVRKAWDQALKRGTDPDIIIAAAAAFRSDPNREDAYTPGAAAWLNRDGWEEPPLPVRGRPKRVGQSEELLRLAMEE